jgi:hypothetical protein
VTAPLPAEALTVAAFVAPNRRQRWLQSLGHPKARAKVLGRLSGADDFLDARYHPLHLAVGAGRERQPPGGIGRRRTLRSTSVTTTTAPAARSAVT